MSVMAQLLTFVTPNQTNVLVGLPWLGGVDPSSQAGPGGGLLLLFVTVVFFFLCLYHLKWSNLFRYYKAEICGRFYNRGGVYCLKYSLPPSYLDPSSDLKY